MNDCRSLYRSLPSVAAAAHVSGFQAQSVRAIERSNAPKIAATGGVQNGTHSASWFKRIVGTTPAASAAYWSV